MFNINLVSIPEVTMSGRIKQLNGWGHNGKKNADNLIVFVINGECTFKTDQLTYNLRKGDVILIPKNTFYYADTKYECEYFFFHFIADIELTNKSIINTKELLEQLDQTIFIMSKTNHFALLSQKTTLKSNYEDILLLITKCHNCLIGWNVNQKLLMDVYFCQILLTLSSININSMPSHKIMPTIMEKILLNIQQNYTQNITLSLLSEQFGISKQYIIKLFKKHLSTTVTQYVNKLKLYHSLELLKYSTMNIGEIADYLGFNNSYYFTRLFKKHFLMSPTQFIKKEILSNSNQ